MSVPPAQPERAASGLVPLRKAQQTGWARALAPWLEEIQVEPEAAERLQRAYSKGLVVHTVRMRRLIDPIFIQYLLTGLGLPLPSWSHAETTSPDVDALVRALDGGGSALLFLKRARTLLSPSKTTALSQEHFEALIRLQRRIEHPILVLPESLLWERRATDLRKTVLGALFGDRDAPGRLREVLGFFWHLSSCRFHVGVPIDLRAVLEREPEGSDRVLAKKVRWTLLNHLSREEQIRTGPMQRSAARTRQNVLKDPTLRRFIQSKAEANGNLEAVERKADSMLRQMAADMRYGWLRVLDATIDAVWSRISDGIFVDPEGLELVRRAARRGPVVLVPSHKSHIDYLVLSQVFFKDNMMPPHIAAGDNLNFWPVGLIFRRSGAFFIRRSFKGDKLYTQVFAAYLRRLLKEGHAVEFFIEGGRSRTGKLLPPRMGMLSMCVDPVFDGAVNDVQFIPVSISYEKLVEAKSYARELAGGAKRKENFLAVLSLVKVLRQKFGRVFIDFSEPVSLRVFAASRGVDISPERAPEDGNPRDRRDLVTQLGHRIVYGINAATRATPTSVAALVILARTRRGLAQEELFERAAQIVDFLDARKARLSGSLRGDSLQSALREALGRFAQDGLLLMTPAADGETIYQPTDAGRLALDYYKNNIIHHFVPPAIVCLSVLRAGGRDVPHADVVRHAREISRLLKFEFSFRADQSFETNFGQAAALLLRRRTLEQRGGNEGTWSTTAVGRIDALELASLLSVFFEAYRLASLAIPEAVEEKLQKQRFVEAVLTQAKRQVLEGRILRAETAAKPLMKTALSLLTSRGVLEPGEDIRIADPDAHQALIEELDALLAATT